MQGQEAVSPAFIDAVREELLFTAEFVSRRTMLSETELLAQIARLTSPWWNIALDIADRRAIVHRIAARVHASLCVQSESLVALAERLRQQPIGSQEQYWVRLVVTAAAAEVVTFPEAVRMATSDALWLAHVEVDGRPPLYVLELPAVYDLLVLTTAYGKLHTLRRPPNSLTMTRAAEILAHGTLIADRARRSNRHPPQ